MILIISKAATSYLVSIFESKRKDLDLIYKGSFCAKEINIYKKEEELLLYARGSNEISLRPSAIYLEVDNEINLVVKDNENNK
jgi:hypothetical protein